RGGHVGERRRRRYSLVADVSLSRNRLPRAGRDWAARFGDSAVGPALVGCRRDRLRHGHIIFCEQTPALFAFYLAPVRPRRHELPLYCGNFLRSLTRLGQDESAR